MTFNKHPLYKAGARLCRTGGKDARRTMNRWCRDNGLDISEIIIVLRGFTAEQNKAPADRCGRLG